MNLEQNIYQKIINLKITFLNKINIGIGIEMEMEKNEKKEVFFDKLEKLSETEKKFFSMVRPRSGVVILFSRPGEAKSAITRSIANKLDIQYIEIRLSQVDETDIGLFPKININNKNNDEDQEFVKFVPPEWAIMANSRPTFIHFEELNRASLTVRNAALQILNERTIGYKFFFNENVYMIASGNLGDKDGTIVEEMDSALNNRLIHVKHELKFNDWLENFAEGRIHQTIINFLSVHTQYFYKTNDANDEAAYATPRTWTFLSDFIVTNFGYDSTIEQFIDSMSKISQCYIGSSSHPFIKYLRDTAAINIKHVMEDYNRVADKIEGNRSKQSEILQEIRSMNIFLDCNEKQIKNIFQFLHKVDKDPYTAFVLELMKKDLEPFEKTQNYQLFKKEFKDVNEIIKNAHNVKN